VASDAAVHERITRRLTTEPPSDQGVNAAAHLLHAYDGLKVALHGSTPDVLAGEMHVDMVAEEAAVDTLAELVLGVHDAL
jgi:hypothetical protein